MGHLSVMLNEIDSTLRQHMDDLQREYRRANMAPGPTYRFVISLLRAVGTLLSR